MGIEELKQVIREVLNEGKPREKNTTRKKSTSRKVASRKKLTVTHKLIITATIMYIATWIVAVVSWFMYREISEELLKYGTYLYGAALATYTGKSAYEYGKKYDPNYEEQDGV